MNAWFTFKIHSSTAHRPPSTVHCDGLNLNLYPKNAYVFNSMWYFTPVDALLFPFLTWSVNNFQWATVILGKWLAIIDNSEIFDQILFDWKLLNEFFIHSINSPQLPIFYISRKVQFPSTYFLHIYKSNLFLERIYDWILISALKCLSHLLSFLLFLGIF